MREFVGYPSMTVVYNDCIPVILVLRTYALYGRKLWVLVLTISVGVVNIGIGAVSLPCYLEVLEIIIVLVGCFCNYRRDLHLQANPILRPNLADTKVSHIPF